MSVNIIDCLLGCESRFREYELAYAVTGHVDIWLQLMIDLEFFVDGKFLQIKDILIKCSELSANEKVITLEAVYCDLSFLGALMVNDGGDV